MANSIHIALALDTNYIIPTYALLNSIFKNNNPINLNFHLIAAIDTTERDLLEKYVVDHGSYISFYALDEILVVKYEETLRSHWSLAVYYKLFFPEIVDPKIERLLYMDIDMLVLNNLSSLFNEKLSEYPIGAVYDNYVKSQKLIEITKDGEYFNSGMILFNLPAWRAQRISQKVMKFLEEQSEKIIYVDQDVLNATLKDNWCKLDKKYNLLTSYIPEDLKKSEFDMFLNDVVIMHYTLQRPWFFLSKHRFRYLFFHYLKYTPKAREKVVVDFAWNKLIAYLKIRIIEWYIDHGIIKVFWRKLKRIFIRI